MAGTWVRTGTVTVTSGSKKVTGNGTSWLSNLLQKVGKGCMCVIDNVIYEVDYVTADTELYLVETYSGATAAGKAYKIQVTITDTIPELSSRISQSLAYANGQYSNLQTWAAGAGNVTLAMPDGTRVTVPALSNLQPKDNLLTALAGLTTSADKFAYFTGSDSVSQTALTSFARSLLDDTDANAMLSTLGFLAIGKSVATSTDKNTAAAVVGSPRSISDGVTAASVIWSKLAELVTNIGQNPNDFTAIISGLENYGYAFGASTIIRAGTRNGANLRVYRLFGGDLGQFGYVNNATTGKTEIWLKRNIYSNKTTITVLNNLGATVSDGFMNNASSEPVGIVYAENAQFDFGIRPKWAEGTPWDSGNLPSEIGTFTPYVFGSTTAGTATYTAVIGRYTRINNRVFFHITLIWTGHTGVGALRIGGMPFVSQITTYNIPTCGAVLASGIVFDGSLVAMVANGQSNIYLRCTKTNAAYVDVMMAAAGTLIFSGSYEI